MMQVTVAECWDEYESECRLELATGTAAKGRDYCSQLRMYGIEIVGGVKVTGRVEKLESVSEHQALFRLLTDTLVNYTPEIDGILLDCYDSPDSGRQTDQIWLNSFIDEVHWWAGFEMPISVIASQAIWRKIDQTCWRKSWIIPRILFTMSRKS